MEKLVYICNIAAQIELTCRIPGTHWCNCFTLCRDLIKPAEETLERSRIIEGEGRKKRDNETALGQRSFSGGTDSPPSSRKTTKNFPHVFWINRDREGRRSLDANFPNLFLREK